MSNLAQQLQPAAVQQLVGRVLSVDGVWQVAGVDATICAQRAVSCLVEPIPGDKVLVMADAFGDSYILAVLERTSQDSIRLGLTGDAEWVQTGALSFTATSGISLSSPSHVGVHTQHLQVDALVTEACLEQVQCTGHSLTTRFQQIRQFAATFDSLVERWYQKAVSSFRRIEQVDSVQAGQVDYQSRSTLALHGQYTAVTASDVVKIDGEQIHLG